MNEISNVLELLPREIRIPFKNLEAGVLSRINEIRIRRGLPIVIVIKSSSYFLAHNGEIQSFADENLPAVSNECFESMFYSLCDYSIYSNSDNLKNGYITLKNGARVGISSTAVYEDNRLISVKNVMGLNIRIPSQALGCSMDILNFLFVNSNHSIIVAGPPSSGKTTLLRDMAYNLSNGFNDKYRKVTIIDERNEFAGKREDEFTLKVGANCDVLTAFSKDKGIEIATRTLSPEIIVCDEISRLEELESIMFGFSCGVNFLLSVHIGTKEDLYTKPIINKLLGSNEFEYIILLDGHTYTADVIDVREVKNEIYRRNSYNPINDLAGHTLFK